MWSWVSWWKESVLPSELCRTECLRFASCRDLRLLRFSEGQTLFHRLQTKTLSEMERPPQLDYAQNWDAAVDITLRRLVYGSLGGAASALLLFRSPTSRWAAVAFGVGAGVGSAFSDSSELFRGLFGANFSAPKPVDASKPKPVEVQA